MFNYRKYSFLSDNVKMLGNNTYNMLSQTIFLTITEPQYEEVVIFIFF